jgi:hydrogenase maturation protease
VIGIGNPDRGDDGAGRAVARRLSARNPFAIEVRECAGEAAALMEAWTGFDDVVLVDACRGAGGAGSVHRFEPDDIDRFASAEGLSPASTHGFGAAAAIGLARALGTLPSRLAIYAIEAARADAGADLSPDVGRAVEHVVTLLVQESQSADRKSAGTTTEPDSQDSPPHRVARG